MLRSLGESLFLGVHVQLLDPCTGNQGSGVPRPGKEERALPQEHMLTDGTSLQSILPVKGVSKLTP